MNISEARAVNVLLHRLLVCPVEIAALEDGVEPLAGHGRPTDEDVFMAARELALKAHKALGAGWNQIQVEDANFRPEYP